MMDDLARAECVAGPVGLDDTGTDENGNPVWEAEVQSLGGYSVIATVYGGSEAQARARQLAIIAALASIREAA